MTPAEPKDLLTEEQLRELALVRAVMLKHPKEIERERPLDKDPLPA